MANSMKDGIWAGQKTRRDHDAVNGIANGYYLPSGYIAPHLVAHDLTDRQREILHILSRKPSLPLRGIRAAMDNTPPDRRLREELLHLKNSVWFCRPGTGVALPGRCGGMT